MNTTPLPRGIDAWDHIPRHELTAAELEMEARHESLPDHYPLITPQGRIEVAELRDHGLYHNRRFGGSLGWYQPDEEPSYELVEADYRYIPDNYSDDYAPPAPTAVPVPVAAPPKEPAMLALNTEPLKLEAPSAVTVKPRMIDVADALASRR